MSSEEEDRDEEDQEEEEEEEEEVQEEESKPPQKAEINLHSLSSDIHGVCYRARGMINRMFIHKYAPQLYYPTPPIYPRPPIQKIQKQYNYQYPQQIYDQQIRNESQRMDNQDYDDYLEFLKFKQFKTSHQDTFYQQPGQQTFQGSEPKNNFYRSIPKPIPKLSNSIQNYYPNFQQQQEDSRMYDTGTLYRRKYY